MYLLIPKENLGKLQSDGHLRAYLNDLGFDLSREINKEQVTDKNGNVLFELTQEEPETSYGQFSDWYNEHFVPRGTIVKPAVWY